MTDEHFIRQWTDGHERFSADVDKALARLRSIIDAAYGEGAETARNDTPSRSEAMLAGVAATALTALLFVSTVAVVTPGTILA
jgi:hypothetical protein